jgi:hypothetical protein
VRSQRVRTIAPIRENVRIISVFVSPGSLDVIVPSRSALTTASRRLATVSALMVAASAQVTGLEIHVKSLSARTSAPDMASAIPPLENACAPLAILERTVLSQLVPMIVERTGNVSGIVVPVIAGTPSPTASLPVSTTVPATEFVLHRMVVTSASATRVSLGNTVK